MGRRQGRTTRFRIGDPAAVVSSVPPDALFARCFGIAAGEASPSDDLGGIAALRRMTDQGVAIPPVPLSTVAGDRDFRLPETLESEALEAALEIMSRAERLAELDLLAASTAVGEETGRGSEQVGLVCRTVAQGGLASLVRRELDLPGWWAIPHVPITFVNAPRAGAWQVRLASPSEEVLFALSSDAVEAFGRVLDGEGRLEDLAGVMPKGLGTFCLPPHGVLTRVEYAGAEGGYWLRSAETRLRQLIHEALLALPAGRHAREASLPWSWTAAFSSKAGLAAGIARLGTWGRPSLASVVLEGPFRPGLDDVEVVLAPKAAGEAVGDIFEHAAAEMIR